MTKEFDEKVKEAGNKYWNENKDYHDSDGVDVHQVYTDGARFGITLAEQKIAELEKGIKVLNRALANSTEREICLIDSVAIRDQRILDQKLLLEKIMTKMAHMKSENAQELNRMIAKHFNQPKQREWRSR